mmetsp:Transcript_640/g.1089  ORF Transcript_640/g.1089 Transcript_640/m.1089 type:complete len:200 (+) Transcript_640:1840-2439(+)
MEEGRFIKNIAEESMFGISCDHSSKPVVRDDEPRDHLEGAQCLQRGLRHNGKGLGHIVRTTRVVGRGEEGVIVQEQNVHALDSSLVHSHRNTFIANHDVNVLGPPDAISSKVPRLSFSVLVIVWGDDYHIGPHFCKGNRQLIHHDTQSANRRPLSKFRGNKHQRSNAVAGIDLTTQGILGGNAIILIVLVFQVQLDHSH